MPHLISIVGPTGVGKSAVAMRLAQQLQCPIISADSVQIYRGLDIGSGKVSRDEQAQVRHYLLDILDPNEAFNAGEFARQCDVLLAELWQHHATVIVVGGTGLYFQAIWEGFDAMPEVEEAVRAQLNADLRDNGLAPLQAELERCDPATWAVIDQQNPARIVRALEVYRATGRPISAFRSGQKRRDNPWQDIKVGLELPRADLYARIDARVAQMMADGWLAETAAVMAAFGPACKGLGSLGYRELVGHLQGQYGLSEAVALIQRNTRRYAKRQFTWFRKYDDVRWFAPRDWDAIAQFVGESLGR